jgi:hypothetical protein
MLQKAPTARKWTFSSTEEHFRHEKNTETQRDTPEKRKRKKRKRNKKKKKKKLMQLKKSVQERLKHKSVPSKEQRKPQRDQARAPTAG